MRNFTMLFDKLFKRNKDSGSSQAHPQPQDNAAPPVQPVDLPPATPTHTDFPNSGQTAAPQPFVAPVQPVEPVQPVTAAPSEPNAWQADPPAPVAETPVQPTIAAAPQDPVIAPPAVTSSWEQPAPEQDVAEDHRDPNPPPPQDPAL
ncbi:MAG: hypothetical protein ACR2FM_02680 [Candidatus Saccharimonadales bacterium]